MKMKKVLAILLIGCLLFALTGCGNNNSENNAVQTSGSGYKDTVYTAFSPLDTADPYGSTASACQIVSNMTFDTLTYLDVDTGNVCAELAKSWEDVSEAKNGGSWKVTLQENVVFHDGSAFTAEDVKFTWEYAATGAGNVVKPNAASAYVKEYEIVDPLTIIFHLVSPMPDFPSYLETKIYSKTAFDAKGAAEACVIGTGPYFYDKELTSSGKQYGFTRNEKYWRGLEQYPTKHIVFREIADANTRIAALISGEVDYLFDIPASSYNTVKNSSGVTVKTRSGANSYYLGFNYSNPEFDNLEVRKAFAMAINKQDIVNVFYEGGIGGTESFNFCVPTGLGYKEVESIAYNPDMAKSEFVRLGLAGKHYVLIYTPAQARVAEVYQSNLSAAGLSVELKQVESANWSSFKGSQTGYDLFTDMCAYQGALLYNFNRFFYTGGSSNVYGFYSADYEALQDAVKAETTWDGMLTKFGELQQWVASNIPVVPTVRNNMICAYRNNVGGIVIAPSTNYMDLATIYVTK